MRYDVHPAANIFPMLPADRLRTLAKDIKINGQREPIQVLDDLIIDGRNRQKACEMAGVEPRYEHVAIDIDPFAFVWSLNGERRDLTADQRYLLWKDCSEQSTAWQSEQKRIRDEANAKRAEATESRPRNSNGTLASAPTSCGQTGSKSKAKGSKTAKGKAKASKTNRGAVERMDKLAKARPDLAEKVKIGEITAAAAIREMKKDEVVEKLESIEAREVKKAQGVYDVIVLDPPWPMKKIERDERPNQVEFDYPTMNEDELAKLKIPAADDCHVWVWTTHKFLPMALRLLDAWGLKYVCAFTWHKPGGFQPVGLPQFNCEFALYARKGSPQFIDTKAFPVCFNAPRGAHSEKPEEFYETLRRVTAGRRIDMFNRRQIDGFDGWGNESA